MLVHSPRAAVRMAGTASVVLGLLACAPTSTPAPQANPAPAARGREITLVFVSARFRSDRVSDNDTPVLSGKYGEEILANPAD